MVLWRTDVNKAIAAVRGELEARASVKMQAFQRMVMGKQVAVVVRLVRDKLVAALKVL
jgi:hypothetical protein